MGDRKKKGFRFFRNSGSGDLSDPLAGSARVQSDSDLRPEQPLGEQKPQQAALSPPTMTRVRRIFRLGRRSPSPGHGVERERNTPTANSYQNSADPASECARPYSSYSDSSALQINAGGDVTVGPSGGHGSPSSACAQGSSAMSVSAPIIQISHSDSESMASKNPIPPSICSPHTPTSICHVQASAETDVQAPHTNSALDPDAMEASSQVWAKALEIAKKKLSDKNLPPLDLTNLTSQSAEENIEAVIKALNTAQEDDKKNRWSYTWRGKEVIVVERLGKILKNVEKYSQVVNIAIQANPQVSALVWAGVWAIMRVALNHVEAIEGFEVAIAALLEKMSICEFYAGIYIGAPLSSLSAANSLQRQCMLDSALPELYASVIVFAVKARVYFEARGIRNLVSTIKSFDIEFQPFIGDINAKEAVIREYADAATMERIRNIEGCLQDITSELKSVSKFSDDRVLELLRMLTPLEPLKRHQDVKLLRTKNAAAWLLGLESFCKWRDSNTTPVEKGGRVFSCYGIPGAGKTVISSVVIDNIYSQNKVYSNIGIACLYADYKDQSNQTLAHILGSFLRQFLTTASECIPDALFEKLDVILKQGGKVGTEDIMALLKIRLQQLKRAFICIDAVDELDPNVQRQLFDVLRELGTNYDNTRLFLTGRGHIESEVQKRLHVLQKHQVVITASEQDIQEFLEQQIKDDLNPDAMDKVLAKDIIDKIIKKSQGMFLLPSLHIKMVLGMPTKSKRRKALEMLPNDLYDSFRGVITRIRECTNSSQADLGMRVLMWLHFAYRPLKLAELQHALAVEKGDTEFDADNIPPRKPILDYCLGLVIVDEETLTVRFVHYTLEEYFRKYTEAEFPTGHSYIAETCLTYLNFGELRQNCTRKDSLNKNKSKYTFLSYAAHYWGTYYIEHQCNDNLTRLANMILDHEIGRPPCAIQALYQGLNGYLSWRQRIAQPPSQRITQRFSGAHVMAYFGLSENMAYFCNMERNIELKDDSERTPLSWAAAKGHEAVVRLLIARDDVYIHAQDNYRRTPLSWAAKEGHEAVVRLLIERDGDGINAKDEGGMTPLSLAAMSGHEAVVRLLIARDGVDINAKTSLGWTPLSSAAMSGHEAVVRLLIERDDVDINAKGNYGETPLILAANAGREAIVRLLIARDDVDINAKDDDGRTPLSWAAKEGHEAIVRLLIARDDVDINAKDNNGRTPLSWADAPLMGG